MDELTKNQIQKQLTDAKSILVAVSQQKGFDAEAAGLALFLSFKKLGKNVSIIAPQPKIADAQKLYGVDKIGQVGGQKNLVIVIDNAIETVDKITYYLEGNKLKIVVHSLKDTNGPSQKDVLLNNSVSPPNIIFAIGFDSKEELKNEVTHEQDISSESWIVNINNPGMSQKFAHVNIDDPNSSSLSEQTCLLIQQLDLPIDEDIAFNLYSGLKEATKMFSLQFAKPSTFEIAQFLIKYGAGNASFAQIPRAKNAYQTFANQSQTAPQVNQINTVKSKLRSFPPINARNMPSFEKPQTPIREVETKEQSKESWLKPPKIYRGSKSFDRES